MADHQLQNAMTVLTTTPDREIVAWFEASFTLLERIAGPSAKNIQRQRERRDLDGALDGLTWIAARIQFDGLLSVDAARVKTEGELMDAALRTPRIAPSKMH